MESSGTQSAQPVSVMALTLDPTKPDAVYAGTEHHGVYRSGDAGETWEQWGLPATSVFAILLDGASRLIWAGTEEGVFQRELD
jgi:hypothetical protein